MTDKEYAAIVEAIKSIEVALAWLRGPFLDNSFGAQGVQVSTLDKLAEAYDDLEDIRDKIQHKEGRP